MTDEPEKAEPQTDLPVMLGEAELLSTVFEDVMKYVTQTADLDD